MTSVIQVEHETANSIKRTTKEGRQLTYDLHVLQQPERARACASADRRPIDPPPVVQLRIFEGEEKKDVTYAYNANFFLFTTLEPARPINQPRVQPTPQPMPVLTGMPVAGMAYLDRPDPAGYFIFPDLSVRHEGKYRLNFNLYEEIKEPKDEDATPPTSTASADKPLAGPMSPQAHVHFRLEVRSLPFTVYSAKKFPGLAESTYVSRVVAEQGCRVRIRRDVRMRRRDAKPGKGYDEYDEEAGYARSERYVTPDVYNKSQGPDRPRSVSNGSVHGSVHSTVQVGTPYANESRRLSQQDLGYFPQSNFQQHPPPPVPVQPTHQNNTVSHLNFGGSTTNQYQVPSLHPTTPSAVPAPPSYSYMPNNGNYTYQAPAAPSRSVPTSQNYAYSQSIPQPQPQPQYSQTTMYAENSHDYQPDNRRASMPVNTQQNYQTQPVNSYGHVDNRPHSMLPYYAPTVQHPAPRPMTPHSNGQSLPPLSTIQYEKKYEPPTAATAHPTSAISTNGTYDPNMAAKYNATSYSSNNNNSSSYSSNNSSSYSSNTSMQPPMPLSTINMNNTNSPITIDPSRSSATNGGGKRSFGAVFDSSHLDRPMHSGMRPRATDQGREVPQVEAEDGSLEDEYDIDLSKMLTYKRADGSMHMKKCVSPRNC
ncbi:MAG: hypothetical protein Q9169_007550 [Polycauliona sp. 2 TL-2023]